MAQSFNGKNRNKRNMPQIHHIHPEANLILQMGPCMHEEHFLENSIDITTKKKRRIRQQTCSSALNFPIFSESTPHVFRSFAEIPFDQQIKQPRQSSKIKLIHQSRHLFLHLLHLPLGSLLFLLLFPQWRSEDFPDDPANLLLLLGRARLEGLREEQLQQLEHQPHHEKHAKNGDHVDSPHQFQHPTRILQSQSISIPSEGGIPPLVQALGHHPCNNLMLGLFFEKGEKVGFLPGGSFLRVSNNLDSHYYVLERVKAAKQDYIQLQYFDAPHPQLLEYFTAWQEKELVQQEEVPAAKKPKEKKGIGGLLSKKSMTERIPGKSLKETKEELPVMVEEDVLYVQLESFSEAVSPIQETETRQFMALIYLLAMRVFERFNCWPQMLPVITESKHYKFLKRGLKVELQLARLFEFIYREEKMKAIGSWAPGVAASMMELDSEDERKELLGAFLKEKLELILEGDFSIKVRKGQECQVVTVAIEDASTLVLKELALQLSIEEYELTYYHHDSETRQIIMEHNTEPALVLEGNRSNLIIKYLKQFVIA